MILEHRTVSKHQICFETVMQTPQMQVSNPGKGTLDDMREANITLFNESFLPSLLLFDCKSTYDDVYATMLNQKDQNKRHGIARSFLYIPDDNACAVIYCLMYTFSSIYAW